MEHRRLFHRVSHRRARLRRPSDICRRPTASCAVAVATLLGSLSNAAEIVIDMPEGPTWIELPGQTMGPSYQRQWAVTGLDSQEPEWLITVQRLQLVQPKPAAEGLAVMEGLSREACTAVKLEGPTAVETNIGEGVLGRVYCAQHIGGPNGMVTDHRIAMLGTTMFSVTSQVRTPASTTPGVFAPESKEVEQRLARSAAFVRNSVRFDVTASERLHGVELENPGNLAATSPLGCVAAGAVSSGHTAADIASGARACFDAGDYDGAANLFLIANALAYYDTLRVTDPSAHAALTALFADRFEDVPLAERGRLGTAMDALANDDGRGRLLCAKLAALGPPDYRPTYMLAHGLASVVRQPGEPELREIDRAAGWREAMAFARCPPP